jgi:hypothetical protein
MPVFQWGDVDNWRPLCSSHHMSGQKHITVASMRQQMTPEVRATWLLMLNAITAAKGTDFSPRHGGSVPPRGSDAPDDDPYRAQCTDNGFLNDR